MRKLLILGAPIFQIPIIIKAKQMGIFVGIVDINKDAPGMPYADISYVGSIKDKKKMLEIANEFKPNGIISGACDTSVNTVAFLCEKLGLLGNSELAALQATDKVQMLKAFEKAKVPHPNFYVLKRDEIKDMDIKITYPVIIKPADSSGGRGVYLVKNRSQLLDAMIKSSSAGTSGDILIEEYLEGPEVSVEVLVVDGIPHILQITDKITSGEPNFYELGHIQPSSLSANIKEEIKKVASMAVLAVGLENTAAHVEIKVTPEGAKMIELGARMGGDCITTYLIDNSISGINMSEVVINLSLGEKVVIPKYKNNNIFVAVKFLPARKGNINSIYVDPQITTFNNIVAYEITGVIGKEYQNAKDDSERFAYVVAKGKSPQEAINCCDEALKLIKVDLI